MKKFIKIKDWEKYIFSKYTVKKIENFIELRKYLTCKDSYQVFTPEEVTETEIMNDEYYAAYVFDESEIAGRKVTIPSAETGQSSGWNTFIFFIASLDKIHISNDSIHQSNGLTIEELTKFILDVDPLNHQMINKKIL